MIQFLSTETSASTMELIVSLLPMILIILVLFLVVYLPQKRQDKKDAAMRSSIEIGDKVTTIGGIVGIVFGHQRQGRHHCSRDRSDPHQDPLPPHSYFQCGKSWTWGTARTLLPRSNPRSSIARRPFA